MLALVGGSRDAAAAELMAHIVRAGQAQGDMSAVMRDPGAAAATGLHAFGEADYAGAFANLSAARGSFQKMGGSHAQRDVFERLTIEAGLRAGRLDETEAVLRARTRKRAGQEDQFAADRMRQIADMRAVMAHALAAE